MCDIHAEIVILHTMGKQVNDLSDNSAKFETFKIEITNVLNSLFDNQNKMKNQFLENQNQMKQELFLIRNNQKDEKKNIDDGSKVDENKKNDPKSEKMKKEAVKSNKEEKAKQSFASKVKETTHERRSENPKPVNNDHKETSKSVDKPKPASVRIDEVIWFGTSLSKALDKKKFEHDTKKKIKMVKAFGIRKEENQYYPE